MGGMGMGRMGMGWRHHMGYDDNDGGGYGGGSDGGQWGNSGGRGETSPNWYYQDRQQYRRNRVPGFDSNTQGQGSSGSGSYGNQSQFENDWRGNDNSGSTEDNTGDYSNQ